MEGRFRSSSQAATLDPLLIDWKQTRREKEKSIEEKKATLPAKFFCGHPHSIDLIGPFEHIRRAN